VPKNYPYHTDNIKTLSVNTLIKSFVVFLINVSFATITLASQFPNEYPSFIPPGFSKELKANYRIVEHSPSRNLFYIHDTDKIKITKEGITMYPPIYMQSYLWSNWVSEVVQETVHTLYIKENIYLIERDKPIHQSSSKRLFVPEMNYPHVAKDEETLEIYTQARKSKNINILQPTVIGLYTKRKMFQVENNVKVKILESKNDRVRIKVLGGKYKGRIGWVISDWIK